MSNQIAAAGGQSRLTMAEAVQARTADKQAAQAEAKETNPASEAARTLALRRNEVRQQREAELQAKSEEDQASVPDGGQAQAEDTPSESDAVNTDENPDLADQTPESDEQDQPAIEVDGKKWTAEEIKRGALRQDDYTRKTQQAAEMRRTFEERSKALDVSIARINEVAQLASAMLPQLPPKPMYQGDRDDYIEKLGQWENIAVQYQHVSQLHEQARLLNLQQMEAQKQAAHAELGQSYWKPDTVKTNVELVERYAASVGYTPEEIQALAHARYITTLDKARQWDELQASKAKIQPRVAKAPPVQKPNARQPSQAAALTELNAARERFQKQPNIANGVALRQLEKQQAARRAN